ncbi:MFS transporter [Arthrobacter sp. AG1021]|uniref:MFS transporter n=1 Tax=Arthrobacter sp. AG1021 TaxID=2183908 RepID=UPI0011C3EED2|nr:MFS transporter [Arthrobacter sp. AG1021]
MGRMEITQNQRPVFVSASRDEYTRFIQSLRKLLAEEITRTIDEDTKMDREMLQAAIASRDKWANHPNFEKVKPELEAEIESRKRSLSESVERATHHTEMRAQLELPKGMFIDITGDPQDLFNHPDVHRARKIKIDVARLTQGSSIRVELSWNGGLSAIIKSNNEQWFHSTVAKFKQELGRLRPPWAWLRSKPMTLVYFVIWSAILSIPLVLLKVEPLSVFFYAVSLGGATFWPVRASFVADFEITDAPRGRSKALYWILGIAGALVMAVLGGILTQLVYPGDG